MIIKTIADHLIKTRHQIPGALCSNPCYTRPFFVRFYPGSGKTPGPLVPKILDPLPPPNLSLPSLPSSSSPFPILDKKDIDSKLPETSETQKKAEIATSKVIPNKEHTGKVKPTVQEQLETSKIQVASNSVKSPLPPDFFKDFRSDEAQKATQKRLHDSVLDIPMQLQKEPLHTFESVGKYTTREEYADALMLALSNNQPVLSFTLYEYLHLLLKEKDIPVSDKEKNLLKLLKTLFPVTEQQQKAIIKQSEIYDNETAIQKRIRDLADKEKPSRLFTIKDYKTESQRCKTCIELIKDMPIDLPVKDWIALFIEAGIVKYPDVYWTQSEKGLDYKTIYDFPESEGIKLKQEAYKYLAEIREKLGKDSIKNEKPTSQQLNEIFENISNKKVMVGILKTTVFNEDTILLSGSALHVVTYIVDINDPNYVFITGMCTSSKAFGTIILALNQHFNQNDTENTKIQRFLVYLRLIRVKLEDIERREDYETFFKNDDVLSKLKEGFENKMKDLQNNPIEEEGILDLTIPLLREVSIKILENIIKECDEVIESFEKLPPEKKISKNKEKEKQKQNYVQNEKKQKEEKDYFKTLSPNEKILWRTKELLEKKIDMEKNSPKSPKDKKLKEKDTPITTKNNDISNE